MKHKGISNTAAYIAIKFYGLTLNPKVRSFFSEELVNYYEKVVQYLPSSLSWYHRSLGNPLWRKLFVFSEELLLPGDLMHIVCRKYYLQNATDRAIAEGTEQLIILGAGFDHTGALTASEDVAVFEIDTPDMIREKDKLLSTNGLMPGNLHLCALNVNNRSISEMLTENSAFDPAKKTLVLAEGFFDYIPLLSAENLLKELKALSPQLLLHTTFFSLDELNFLYRSSFTWGVAIVGEAIKLPLDLKGFEQLLERTDYNVKSILGSQDMAEDLVRRMELELPVLQGFYIVKAECR